VINMGLLEWLVIIFLILWVFGGLAFPGVGAVNLLLLIVVIYILYRILGGRKV